MSAGHRLLGAPILVLAYSPTTPNGLWRLEIKPLADRVTFTYCTADCLIDLKRP